MLISQLSKVSEKIEDVTKPIEDAINRKPWEQIDWMDILFHIGHIILLLVLGIFSIRMLRKGVRWMCQRRNVGATITLFLDRVLRIVLNFTLLILVAHELGFQTASLIAILGSVGLAIGLALQGTLSDLASGIMIILLRPLRIGDYVYLGRDDVLLHVEEIRLFNTSFVNPRGFTVIVPNKKILQNDIINLSLKPWVKICVAFSISYDSDLDEVRQIILNVMQREPLLLKSIAPSVSLTGLGDSDLQLVALAPVHAKDYLAAASHLREKIKKALDEAGIEIPFPQIEMRLYEQSK